MVYQYSKKKNSTITIKVMCAIVFCLFSVCWLYWFQADVLAVAQHILSGNSTHYNRSVGAVLITVLLLVLQQVISSFVRLYRRAYAFTYFPSMLILGVISDIDSTIDQQFTLGAWYWVFPLALCIWGSVTWVVRKIQQFHHDNEPSGMFSQRGWVNMLWMVLMMLFVAAVGNSNAVFHFRTHVEVAILEKDIDEALRTGNESAETDVHLTMLRAYALSLKGALGERLFEYPVNGSGDDLLPLPSSQSRMLLLNPDSLFLHLGAKPLGKMTTSRYLYILERDSLATSAVADYRLCGLLVDKRIDDFVNMLPVYYAINDSLPKHYKEALTLYAHLRSHPVLIYQNAVMAEDWKDFQKLQNTYASLSERRGKVEERYALSYWYYYYYCGKKR